MFDIFGQIRTLIKSSNVRIDNNVFTLHYRLTVIFLVTFSLIIGSRKYFGDPIDCTAYGNNIERIVDNFCWFNSYILVPKVANDPYGGDYQRYRPVINEAVKSFEDLNNPDSKYKAYFLHAYQWIEFILFFQAVLFFLPRYLWRYCWEQGRIRTLTQNFSLVTLKQEEDKQKVSEIIRYIRRNKFDHFEYAWKFIICEVLNFANVLAQFLVVRHTFSLSWDVMIEDFFTSSSNVNPESPLNLVFPNLARCEVPTAGGAGHSYMLEFCVLPVNVFTTKMYIFLWFYFYGLSVVSGITLIYRIATIAFPHFRFFLLKRTAQGLTDDCSRAIRNLGYGEWFVLRLVGKNMDPFSFKSLIKDYNDEMVASRPSFSLVGGAGDKIYNADLAAMHARKDSIK